MTVFLTHASTSPRSAASRLALHLSPGAAYVRWVFLGRDYGRLRAWERALGPRVERVRYGQRLQEVGMCWRRPYLDWIADLGERHPGLPWWSSQIAERNTYGASLFLDICHVEIARAIWREGTSPLLVVAENPAVLRTIARDPELQGRCVRIGRSGHVTRVLWWLLALMFVWGRYLIGAFTDLAAARLTRPRERGDGLSRDTPRILIHSCIDELYFGEWGEARDRYFGVLPNELRQRGWEVRIVPWVFAVDRSRWAVLRWFRRQPDRYLIPDDWYTMGDSLWAAWVVLRGARLPRGAHRFADIDLTLLLAETRRRQALNTSAAAFVRYVRLVRHLHRAGVRVDRFIDTFENMIAEKFQVIGFRRYMPEVTTVGFQHYLAPHALMLNQFTTAAEATRAPHPDVVVCTSEFMRELMAREGFPVVKLRLGAALRYGHLLDGSATPGAHATVVLVVLPIEVPVMAEMIDKLRDAVRPDMGMECVLKPHPMMAPARREAMLAAARLPSHFSVADGDIAPWLSRTAVGVVAGGTSGLELLLAGIPVIVIGRETDFDMNPLSWFPDVNRVVHSSEELHAELSRILADLRGAREGVAAWASRHRARCVSPIDRTTLDAFVLPRGGALRADAAEPRLPRGVRPGTLAVAEGAGPGT